MYRGLSAMTALVMALLLGLGLYKAYDMIINMTGVPYVLNETEEDAVRLLARAGLAASVSRTSDNVSPAGTVIQQSPGYDTRMNKGETVYLTVSTGPREQEVPDLSGKTEREARDILTKLGYTILVLPERAVSREEVGTVVKQSPRAGEIAAQNGIVQVTLSGGCIILRDLTGYSCNEALGILEKLGIEVKEIKELPVSNEAIDGTVASQQYVDRRDYPLEINTSVIKNSGTRVILAVYRLEESEERVGN